MAPRRITSGPKDSRRLEGRFPFALQRCLELEAIYRVVTADDLAHNEPAWRAWIAGFRPHALHGFMGAFLLRHPERRML